MMPVSHVQSDLCVTSLFWPMLARAYGVGACASNRMLTAVDLTATGVIVNKHFLNVTHSPFNVMEQFGL